MHQVEYHNTPVLLLTGYLGSGKTTLVNHILNHRKNIRFAVIVNDIGEVNIDASLIQKGGVVGQKDDSLVALQNGCICCSLKMDLVEQLNDIQRRGLFDYIVIEASGICEPEPIARTICSIPHMGEEFTQYGVPHVDCVCSVVDALRMQTEFANGDKLLGSAVGEEDIESLIIQQVEFCNIVLLNKVSEVERNDIDRLRLIINQLNPGAKIIETDFADVDLDLLVNTHLFDYDRTEGAAGWVRQIERLTTDDEDAEARAPHHHHHHDEEEHEHCHEHHHHHHDEDDEENHEHHHHHEHGEHCHCHHCQEGHSHTEEYGISTFVYYRRAAFDIDKFDRFVNLMWPKEVIRCKGICYFSQDADMSFLFEQAGVQVRLQKAGQWYATAPEDELQYMLQHDPGLAHDWDPDYGDRMQKLVFIGQKMNQKAIVQALDDCLEES